jgi:hypothetical protein
MGLVGCVVVLGSYGPSSAASATTSTTSVVPHGWKSYDYGKSTISVPNSWTVRRNASCPGNNGAGVLVLGVPTPLSGCQSILASRSYVIVSSPDNVPTATGTVKHTFETINGVSVNIDSDSTPPSVWDSPTLDVRIVGNGPDSNRVLHTLRPLKSKITGPGVVLRIGDACLSGVQWYNAHTASTIAGSDSVIAASCTPAELTGALRSLHPTSTHREIAKLEMFFLDTLCPKYRYLTLCKAGS